jgi:hypothetical protein
MSLIFFKGPRKEQQQLRAQWNCVFEQVTWLRDIILQRSAKEKDTRRRSNNNVDDCLFQVFIETAAAAA